MKKNYVSRYGYLFVIAAISLYSFAPYLFGPGLTETEPVSVFLNGNFPDVTEDANPYAPAFPNITFRDPLTFEPVPNTNRLLVGEIDGEIYWFENNESTTTKTLLRDFSDEMGDVFDGGFLGLAANPRFGEAGHNYIYMYYNGLYGDTVGSLNPADGFLCDNDNIAPAGHYMILRRIQVDPVTFESQPENDLIMMRTKMFGWTHWGGGMKFGLDGFLYLPTGENSGYQRAQEIDDNLYGGVLRLDVNMDASKSHPPIKTMPNRSQFPEEISGEGYYIPNDNPFLSPDGSAFEEYFSLGHRNPHRLSVDRLTGEIYVGEVGGGLHEEVNVIESGKNYGWPVFEGLASGPGSSCTAIFNNMPVENPLTAFTRGDSNALIGGFVYRGSAMPEYYGKYICGNWGGGNRVWSVDTQTGEYNQIFSFLPGDLWGFGEDNNGELYILKRGNTNLYRIQPNTNANNGNFPQFLSQTGAFKDLATLEPSEGVLPYELIESFWSDGAEKHRWMVIPNDGTHDTRAEQIGFSENESWNFPEGTVLIKHFEFPVDENNPSVKKRLETRFTVKTSNGEFYYLTYKWNAQGTDAELLETGLDEDFTINLAGGGTKTQTWTYPDGDDCRTCHSALKNNTLGPRTRYLNSDYLYPKTGVTGNQLVTLSHLGILDENITDNTTASYLTFRAKNSNASLEEKARSYLDLNCAYCHSPGGVAERAGIDMSLAIPIFETGLLDKVVLPGNAQASELVIRMGSTMPGYGMPPLAKNVVDQEGLSLITEWINSLDPTLYGITGVEITSEESTVNVSESLQLTANVLPDNVQVNENVTWTSSNEFIASVDQNGLVAGLLPGTTVITASTYDSGYSATSEITVTQFNGSGPGTCVSNFENENTEISLTPIGFVSGADTIEGTDNITFNSSCAITVSNTDANQPWSRYELQIDLEANGIVAGDGLFISVDAEGSNGNGRFEINAMDAGNTTLDFIDFGTGWSNFQTTIVVPENINAIEFEIYTNYNNPIGGSMVFDNLIVVNTGEIIDVTPPEIVLTGANTLELSELDNYIEPGYTANDDIDGDITNNVIVGGDEVDTNTPGTYVITYNVTDNAGNTANEIRRTVNVFTIRESCAGYFQNDNPNIILPLGSTAAGADNARGITSNTNNSDCAFEVSNFDEGDRWARYNIPIVLAEHDIAPGDRLQISVDADSSTGQGRIAIGQDNTPNTDLTGTNFSGGWSSFSDTVTVPAGITTLNVWLYSNYNSTAPGTVVYDNLNIVNLDGTPCDGAPLNTYFADTDGDGFGDPQNTIDACQLPDGYVTDNTDCDDTRAESYPGAPELCDGLDNNCDGNIDEGAQDCDPVDTTAPVITLDGPAALQLPLGEPYIEPGFLATDDTDGEITANVTIGGDTVDSDTEGTYTITYDVSDAAGNSAVRATRTVTVSGPSGPVTCNDFLENENQAIPLPIGNLTAGGDEIRGTDTNTNNSDCALEVSNFDENQRWARYNIPIVLEDHGIAPGDRLQISVDADSSTGQGRIAIVQNNTPNTVISSYNFSGGWSSFSDTVTVPAGLTTLNVWLYSNYNSTAPGTVVYDNLEIVNLDDNAINLVANVNNMFVSPNPSKDTSTLSFDDPEELTDIFIFDMVGRLIKKFNAQDIKRGNHYELQIYQIPAGTYFVRTRNTKGVEFSKPMIIIE